MHAHVLSLPFAHTHTHTLLTQVLLSYWTQNRPRALLVWSLWWVTLLVVGFCVDLFLLNYLACSIVALCLGPIVALFLFMYRSWSNDAFIFILSAREVSNATSKAIAEALEAARASRTSDLSEPPKTVGATSPASAARSSFSIAPTRRVEWPTRKAALTEAGSSSTAPRNASKVANFHHSLPRNGTSR